MQIGANQGDQQNSSLCTWKVLRQGVPRKDGVEWKEREEEEPEASGSRMCAGSMDLKVKIRRSGAIQLTSYYTGEVLQPFIHWTPCPKVCTLLWRVSLCHPSLVRSQQAVIATGWGAENSGTEMLAIEKCSGNQVKRGHLCAFFQLSWFLFCVQAGWIHCTTGFTMPPACPPPALQLTEFVKYRASHPLCLGENLPQVCVKRQWAGANLRTETCKLYKIQGIVRS